jgi:hypothetical protein
VTDQERYNEATGLAQGLASALYAQANQIARPTRRQCLQSNLAHALGRAEKDARLIASMQELSDLLDKSPDAARVLELLEDVGL